MHLLTNEIRDYAWGSTTAIPEVLGVAPTGEPQAEMWIGAHPDSPSTTHGGERLDHVIEQDRQEHLGSRGHSFESLPFLMKLLAAGSPLSLQVHPTAQDAAAGYAAEEAAGVPQTAPERRYKDPHHKPEMVFALTDFDALCGLRSPQESLELARSLNVEHPKWSRVAELLAAPDGVRAALEFVLRESDESLVDAVADACAAAGPDAPSGVRAVVMLNRAYPNDRGVAASLLLNHVELKPGEALYLPAGNVHAYLSGLAIEVLASSDNVLRAGLTPKHVDVPEVLRTVDFTPLPIPYVRPEVRGAVSEYRPGAEEFALQFVTLAPGAEVTDVAASGPRVVLSLDSTVEVAGARESQTLGRGGSVFIADGDGPITLRGTGRVAVACLPCSLDD